MKNLKFKLLTQFFICFSFFSTLSAHFSTLSAQNNEGLVTEVKIYDNDSTYKLKYFYDNKMKVLETKLYLKNDIWVNLSQKEWYYNDGICEKQVERVFNSNTWIDTYTIEYQTISNKTTEIHKSLTNGTLVEIKKFEFEKENNHIVTQKIYFKQYDTWILSIFTENEISNNLLNTSTTTIYQTPSTTKQYKSSFEYNTVGKLKSQILQERSNTETWRNSQMFLWYYLPDKNLIASQRNKIWDSTNEKWENKEMLTNVYSADNKLIEEISYYWKAMFWAYDLKYDYKYDNAGLLLSKTLSLPIYNKWRNTTTINYTTTLNSKEQKIESVYGFWGGNIGEYVSTFTPFMFNDELVIQKAMKINVSYTDEITDYNQDINKQNIIRIFPNPSDGIFYFDTQKHNVKFWILYNSQGAAIKEMSTLNYSGVIDITEMPKGIYILKAKTQNEILTQKLYKN